MKLVKNENDKNKENISDKEAQEAFIKILKWCMNFIKNILHYGGR